MTWLWMIFGAILLFMALVCWSLCKMGAEADRRMQREYENMMEGRPPNRGGLSRREVTDDDGGA